MALDEPTFKTLNAECVERGKHWPCHQRVESFMRSRFARYQSYGGVKDQFRRIISAVNRFREKSGYPLIAQEKALFSSRPRVVKVY